jgi:diguanylate cyclase (GGDEF)-like protein
VLKAFRTGLSDCVARDHDYAAELRTAIRRSVDRAQRLRELHEEVDYLARLAKSDRLTGIPSRAFLEDRVANLVASGERHGGAFALFMIGIDDFRKINDIHGHAVGDQALKAFSRRLMLTSRASDACGRFGGDEFLYLIDRGVSEETVARACGRLANALAFPMEIESGGLSLSASIGAAIFPSDGATPENLLAAASRALAAARRRAWRYCLAREAATSAADEVAECGAMDAREAGRSRAAGADAARTRPVKANVRG